MLTRLSNGLLGLTWNTAFRPGYTPRAMRRNFEFMTAAEHLVLGQGARFEALDLDGVRALALEPPEPARATLLYLHGGGYFMGSPRGYRMQGEALASRCRARVALIDYRLAPEHPYPAALNDAVQAYRAIRSRYPNEPLIVGGDSAGGGLTLALLLALRDQGEPLPAAAFCVSPWTDLVGTGHSLETNQTKDVWLSRRHIEEWAPWYHGKHDPRTPGISPVYGDYRGLPPLLLFVGDQEVLLDDATRVAQRAAEAGVQVSLKIGRGMQHDWFLLLPWLEESRLAWDELVAFFARSV